MFGMSWNMTAFKAYVGGVAATAGVPVGTFILHLIESGMGDLPSSIDTMIVGAIAYVIGHLAVYVAKNQTA